MNKYHLEILEELKKHKGQGTKYQQIKEGEYIGSTKPGYSIKTSIKKQIIKDWIKRHGDLSLKEYTNLLDSLCNGKSHDEISISGKLLESLPRLRKQIEPDLLDKWLINVEGWAEVDSICQSNFTSEEILIKWNDWKKLISELSKSRNIHKRRASLVLLTGPVRHSSDTRLAQLAFTVIDRLKGEKDILITKAISWLLRDLIKNHRSMVQNYIEENITQLSKIAIRETKRKLLTGKK